MIRLETGLPSKIDSKSIGDTTSKHREKCPSKEVVEITMRMYGNTEVGHLSVAGSASEKEKGERRFFGRVSFPRG